MPNFQSEQTNHSQSMAYEIHAYIYRYASLSPTQGMYRAIIIHVFFYPQNLSKLIF